MTTHPLLTRSFLAVWDIAMWFAAAWVVWGARFDFTFFDESSRSSSLQFAGICAAIQLVVGLIVKLYRGRHRVGSLDELVTLTWVVVVIGVVVGIPFVFRLISLGLTFPRTVAIFGIPLTLLLQVIPRFAIRLYHDNRLERSGKLGAERVLIYGAGNAGQQIGRLIAMDPDSPYHVIGYLDDDSSKRNLHLGRTRVLGPGSKLAKIAADHDARKVILAINTASKELINQVTNITTERGIDLLVMPPVDEMVGGQVDVSRLHAVNVEDLLGRRQVKTDVSEIAGYVNGRVVLITGAGGSIGSEIARQVHKYGPRELVLLDRDEGGLHAVELKVYGQALLDTPNIVLCDIRDSEALDAVFAQHRPDVVFHAAALKHLPMLELYPLEGWKTNVVGSSNVLAAAQRYGVTTYVNISTDKAADATSVLGKTKRMAEELTAWYGRQGQGNFLSVRFGNVLGSRGSMLQTFTQQIEQGGPVTVTHPDIERYFMTIREACELVIQAGAIGKPGDVLVLDMGSPVRILDVAQGLIRRSGKNIGIIYTGLRTGEKMTEVLFSESEEAVETSHPLIHKVTSVPPLDPASLPGFDVASLFPDPDDARWKSEVEDMKRQRTSIGAVAGRTEQP